MSKGGLTILFSGMVASDPYQGGATWAVLQYLLGLKRAGHDLYFVEPVAESALTPKGSSLSSSVNAAYFRSVMSEHGLEQSSALLLAGSRETLGLRHDELRRVARRAALLINVSGMLTDEELIGHIPARVYLDLDPAFNQFWHEYENIDMRFGSHTHFVTVGLSVGQAGCVVPTCGREWTPTLQPIVLEEWPVAERVIYDGLTTVANWRGYGSIERDGVFYGQKAHSLRQFIDLPRRTTEKFMPALAIHADEKNDLVALNDSGWLLLDPREVAGTPRSYRRFIQGSKAEFGIAKSGYVESRCGWFSDRSVCYLASGRPVIAQETGFSRNLPTGEGLLSFETAEDVLTGIERLNSAYGRHARAARAIAEEYFDSQKVLPRLLEEVLACV